MSMRSIHLDYYSMKQLNVSIQKNEDGLTQYKCVPTFGQIRRENGPAINIKSLIFDDEVIIAFQGVDLSFLNEQQLIDMFLNSKRQSQQERYRVLKMIVGPTEALGDVETESEGSMDSAADRKNRKK